jgi:UDP-N-acetylmuramyl pentapeptide synthase
MKKLSITELARIIGAQPFWAGTNESETLVTGVSIDSRTIEPGDSFFAIAGENLDGHDHVHFSLLPARILMGTIMWQMLLPRELSVPSLAKTLNSPAALC